MSKEKEIKNYLNELFLNNTIELLYTKDYELLIAVMLSAQTTDKRVNKVTKVLFDKYKSLNDIKNASLSDVKDIVYQLGNYNKKSKAVIEIASTLLEKYDGKVPNNRKSLESMPMVGRKTASVVLSTLFNVPEIAVDTHVFRVSKRLAITSLNDDVLETEKKLQKFFPIEDWSNIHYKLVLFGRYYCLAKNPKCETCKLKKYCIENKKID